MSATPVHQRTLKTAISCTGVGLHSGARVTMTLHPAPANAGIVFKRSDIAGRAATIPANWRHVVDTRLCTTIGIESGARIGTIEHLMAALFACQIDNIVIELNGPEVPVMDGSAAPFVFLIECAGVVTQGAPRSRHRDPGARRRRRWRAPAVDRPVGRVFRGDRHRFRERGDPAPGIRDGDRARQLQDRDQPRPHLRDSSTRSATCAPTAWPGAARSTTPW